MATSLQRGYGQVTALKYGEFARSRPSRALKVAYNRYGRVVGIKPHLIRNYRDFNFHEKPIEIASVFSMPSDMSLT